MKIRDVIIIGGGPSGIAASIQLKRSGIDILLFEKSSIGGLLINANQVENYPGFPQGITGHELSYLFKQQLINHNISVFIEEVLEVDFKNNLFFFKTPKRVINSRIAIIASGTKHKTLFQQKINKKIQNKIFYEIYPLLNLKQKIIGIVGAGDAAFDYALNLSKNNKVLIFGRGENPKCLPLLKKQVKNNKNITYYNNITIKNIEEEKGKGLILKCTQNAQKKNFHVSILVIAIGRRPNIDFLSSNLKNNLKKLKKEKKIFFIGDLKNGIFRQTAIAVSDGIKTAMIINNILNGEYNENNCKSRKR